MFLRILLYCLFLGKMSMNEKLGCSETAAKPASEETSAYVSLGSNKGDSAALLEEARLRMGRLQGVRIDGMSSLYRTEPQGLTEQPFFVNQVVHLRCRPGLEAEDLLEGLFAIEALLGRERKTEVRNGPRYIDLDLLLFGDWRMDTERLTLPHPRMLERAFVLVPLAEIAPDLLLPHGLRVAEALERLEYGLDGDSIYQSSGPR